MNCPHCGSENLETTISPTKGGHHGRIDCLDCQRFVKWVPKPKEEKAADPRSEVSKKLVKLYSRGFCEICLRQERDIPAPQTLEGHHIIQVKDGGSDDRENVQIVCTSCHRLIHHQRTYLGHYSEQQSQDVA